MSDFNPIWTKNLYSFCKEQNIASIKQIKNPHTGKVFALMGDVTAAIAKKLQKLDLSTSISYFGKDKDGKDQYVLHGTSQQNVLSTTKVSELS